MDTGKALSMIRGPLMGPQNSSIIRYDYQPPELYGLTPNTIISISMCPSYEYIYHSFSILKNNQGPRALVVRDQTFSSSRKER